MSLHKGKKNSTSSHHCTSTLLRVFNPVLASQDGLRIRHRNQQSRSAPHSHSGWLGQSRETPAAKPFPTTLQQRRRPETYRLSAAPRRSSELGRGVSASGRREHEARGASDGEA